MNVRDDGGTILSVNIRRRQVLALLVAVVAGGRSPAALLAVAEGMSAAPIMPDMFTDPRAAERFGRAYLAAHPFEEDPDRLMQRLAAALESDEAEPPHGAEAMFMLLDRTVRRDYAHGEVIVVDGWLLSRSEARLYALSVLYRNQ